MQRKLNIFLILLILGNIAQFKLLNDKLINIAILSSIPLYLVLYIILIGSENKRIKRQLLLEQNTYERTTSDLVLMENERKLIIDSQENLDTEVAKLKEELSTQIENKREKIKNEYSEKISIEKVYSTINITELDRINSKIEAAEIMLNNKKLRLHSLDLDKQNIEPQLDNLSQIEEKLANNNNQMILLRKMNMGIDLAKEVMCRAYEKMKNSITPKFTQNLSKNISKITNGKYKNVVFNEEEGLIVEIEGGNYIPAKYLSIGTIDQLYLSLRLSMIDEMSKEKVPIFLDETFAFYDDERLKNILTYLSQEFPGRQVIIFTCSDRERFLLRNTGLEFNYVKI